MKAVFITGIGTDVGKTIVSTIAAEALAAAYWKPVQAGSLADTDTDFVLRNSNNVRALPETYRLKQASSPHLAAIAENIKIDIDAISNDYQKFLKQGSEDEFLVIEGAGGLLVPLNENYFVLDLIKKLEVPVLLVSRNYLGSINHSLLTAQVCASNGIKVAGWIFNGAAAGYEQQIADWSGYPIIGYLPPLDSISKEVIKYHAGLLKHKLIEQLS